MSTGPVKAAAIYCRISQDRADDRLGVQRQEQLCRELAERKGWTVAEVYVDNDLSATNGASRPAYERMLDDLEAGVRDAVVVVDQDRLTRHTRELEEFIELADEHGVALANVSGDLDLSSSDGRFKARILGAVARQESERKSERLRRQRAQAAMKGKPHPGPRAFGFEDGNVEHRESEATLLRAAARDVLAGQTLRSIADRWNDAGVTTSRGNTWSVNSVRDVLTSPRTAGLRVHRGEVVGEGIWEPIVGRATWERLTALAKSRKRKRGRPPTRLLSAIATCGLCDGPMHSSTSKGTPIYACRRVPGDKDQSCGRLSIVREPLDELVREAVLVALASDDLAMAVAERERDDDDHAALVEQLEADEASLDELAHDHYVDRIIGRSEFLKAREALERRIDAAHQALDATTGTGMLATLPTDVDGLRAWWGPDNDEDRNGLRRRLVELIVDRVDIAPQDPEAPRRFDPDRATIVWKV